LIAAVWDFLLERESVEFRFAGSEDAIARGLNAVISEPRLVFGTFFHHFMEFELDDYFTKITGDYFTKITGDYFIKI